MIRRSLFAVVAIGFLAAALFGCTRVDEASPTPLPTATTQPATPTAQPATLIPLQECEVGLRLEPGEGCRYSDYWESSFDLEIQENGDASFDGSVSGRQFSSRTVRPEEELCICDLKIESDGFTRIIVGLPQAPPIGSIEPLPPVHQPDHEDCTNGLVVRPGEICNFPESYCYFDVTLDGLGRFATVSDWEQIDVRNIDLGDKTISFSASASNGRWTIEHLSHGILESNADGKSNCIADPLVVELAEAAGRGDAATVRRLISGGVDVNARSETGNSALWRAAILGKDIDVTRILLEEGADLTLRDWNGDHVLTGAFWDENLEMVKLLVEAGADVNGIDGNGSPPLRTAIHVENLEIIQYLIDYGADLNQLSIGEPLLASTMDSVEMTRLLIDAGADVNARDSQGVPVLVYAVYRGDAETLKLVLDAGANPEAESAFGDPALRLAMESGSIDMARLLLDMGANPNACDSDGNPPLNQAIRSRNLEMVTSLVEAGANVNDFDAGGRTMLELAHQFSSQDIVEYLIDAGAE